MIKLAQLEDSGIRQASFPIIKTVENFDFKEIPGLNKSEVLKLTQCEYII